MGLEKILEELKQDSLFMENVTSWEILPAREGSYADFPENLLPELKESLISNGISRLYSHQADFFNLLYSGSNAVIVTPTASGKSLSFNLPVMQRLLENKSSRALYMFPTKALSQDQQASLNKMITGGSLALSVYTFDGDTPSSVRMSARTGGRIIITNPDMLHTGILPNHTKWAEFFKNLEYIVLDEMHVYTGVFGSHTANVLRRLFRICSFYGSSPVVAGASATIGNPGGLAETLCGRKFNVVEANGAPSGEKHVIMYNPPVVDRVQGIRRSVILESRSIALRFLENGVKTIVFARSRVNTELIAGYINKSLENIYNRNNSVNVQSYRGGYLPSERRAVEKGLRDGDIQGVVSTNALELGIDIGGLDAAVLAGIPSSAASAWQRAGRAGRSGDISAAVLTASSSPSDQYLVRHPEYFYGRSPESAYIDPDNIFILIDHLKCAVFELPFEDGEQFGSNVDDLLEYLEEEGIVRHASGRWYWSERSYPSESVSLRGAADANVVIVDTTSGKNTVIGEMDTHSAREMLYDGAVYLHMGEQYIVKKLDLENHHAYVETSLVNYYTDALVKSDIKVLENSIPAELFGAAEFPSDLLVRREVSKYKKIRFGSHENIGWGDIFLPDEEMQTRGVFLGFGEGTNSAEAFSRIKPEMQAAVISRTANLIEIIAPVFMRCRKGDLSVAARVNDPHYKMSGIYAYDNYPGGIGLADSLNEKLEGILKAALSLVSSCGCESGCPSCIGALDSRDSLPDNPKTAVAGFLENWIK